MKISMTREEMGWVIYDVANSAFVLIVITAIMPLFFKDVASRGIDPAVSTANWGFANSLASLLLAVAAPVLGTLADYRGFKKRFLAGFMLAGVLATFALATVGEGNWLKCLAIFVVARLGFSGANIFYDAFLVDITEPKRMDWISTAGYAWGYIGSVVPFVAGMALIAHAIKTSGISRLPADPARVTFVIVGLWWLVFSLPLLKTAVQRHFIAPEKHLIRGSFSRLLGTFKEIRRHRQAFVFLLAYFFYIDGVDTIITMATSYGRDIGLGVNMLILAILVIQIVAFPFALVYGRLAQRFSARAMIFAGIGVYVLITLVSFFLPSLPTLAAKQITFWVLAVLVATSMGGIQALSRSWFSRLIPPERSAEFFGFYNIFGKFAAITGPFLMGLAITFTGQSRYGVLSIVVLFILGAAVLTRVRPEPDRKT
jgi:UMF1 family MFS transporter